MFGCQISAGSHQVSTRAVELSEEKDADILDTHEMIRFRVTLATVTLPDLGGTPPVSAVLDVSITYSFNY